MRRWLLGIASGVLGLALTGSAQAHDTWQAHVYNGPAYYKVHGVVFSGGYYYPGHHHPHWERRVWDVHYHRYHYWDPFLHCYYYWYAPRHCFYPVTYSPVYYPVSYYPIPY
jgi:hypothetical protein